MKRLLIFLLFLLWASALQAGEYRRWGQDYRSMAMGGTGISSATNSNALFFNPAALGNVDSWWIDLPMIEAHINDTAKQLTSATSGAAMPDMQTMMDSFMGQRFYMKAVGGVNFISNITKRGFTIGYNYSYESVVDLKVQNPNLPEVLAYANLDYIRQFGFSMPVGRGQMVIGLTAKTVERTQMDVAYGMADVINGVAQPSLDANGLKGSGTGYDIGFIWRMASKYRITWGGVYRQAINLGPDLPEIPEEVAIGVSTAHNVGLFRITGALDMRDLTFKAGSADDRSLNRRIHFGAEMGLRSGNGNSTWLSVRTGFNQGYFTQGAEVALGDALVIGYTRYTEETGEYAGQSPDKRTITYINFGF